MLELGAVGGGDVGDVEALARLVPDQFLGGAAAAAGGAGAVEHVGGDALRGQRGGDGRAGDGRRRDARQVLARVGLVRARGGDRAAPEVDGQAGGGGVGVVRDDRPLVVVPEGHRLHARRASRRRRSAPRPGGRTGCTGRGRRSAWSCTGSGCRRRRRPGRSRSGRRSSRWSWCSRSWRRCCRCPGRSRARRTAPSTSRRRRRRRRTGRCRCSWSSSAPRPWSGRTARRTRRRRRSGSRSRWPRPACR